MNYLKSVGPKKEMPKEQSGLIEIFILSSLNVHRKIIGIPPDLLYNFLRFFFLGSTFEIRQCN
jgi:hypothetical protein